MAQTSRPVIPVFYACDKNFLKFMTVSVVSAIENASNDFNYEFHVLHTGTAPEEERIVHALERDNVRIFFDDVTEHLEAIDGRLPIRDYYTKTTYFRFFIADMFPQFDKAIYIDSDTVVVGDLSELFMTELGDCYLGACHEQVMMQVDEYGSYVEKCLGIDRNRFFNAGVLLLNCMAMRENSVLSQFAKLLSVYDFVVTQDEDYLNIICKDHVRFLPDGWNTEVFGKIPCRDEDIRILHYIMVSKPWHFSGVRYEEYFWDYARKTEVYADIKAIFDSYTDEMRESDIRSGDRLLQTAINETRRDDNYLARAKRMNCSADRQHILEKIDLYEYEGRFDEDVENDPPGRIIQPGEVDYIQRKLRTRFCAKFSYVVAKRYLNSIIKNRQLIVKEIKGSENIASVDSGAVLTCNHFNAMDSFAMQLAFTSGNKRGKRLFRVIREGNYTSFPGFFGFLMRHFYTLPLSSNLQTRMEFVRAVDHLLGKGDFILVYPEQSMWWNYRKPKPLKDGAFFFAAKNKTPVIPCFITMEDSDLIGDDGFPIQEYTIHISKPILPDPTKTVRQNTKEMLDENYREWKRIYEETYGIPLEYTTEKAN